MRWRVPVAALLALVVGGAVGYAVGARDEPEQTERTSFAAPTPVEADHPRLPVRLYRPDPDDPTLEPGIALRDGVRLEALDARGRPTPYALTVPVPEGWEQTFNGEGRWQFTKPGNDPNSFGMRIDVLAGRGQSVERAISVRKSQLTSAGAQDNLREVEFPEVDETGFTATFVEDRYRRVSLERFVPGPDGTAYATIAVYGRERDLEGMSDLVALVDAGLEPDQRP